MSDGSNGGAMPSEEHGALPRRYGDADISGLIKDQQYMRETFAQFRIEDRKWKEEAGDKLDDVLRMGATIKTLAWVVGLGVPAVIAVAGIIAAIIFGGNS